MGRPMKDTLKVLGLLARNCFFLFQSETSLFWYAIHYWNRGCGCCAYLKDDDPLA
jgi:hypothetical protein